MQTSDVLADGTLALERPVSLPQTLDLLIVGGGPAGTAAAFRAKELGLSALVIDYDDLMKRIRDYAKDKLILPHFGGGDQMRFPRGGDLIGALHFEPIDKDDMCLHWRSLFRRFGVPAKIGIELTGIERQPDGTLLARTWNHKTRAEETFHTRHLALSIGRGVPRRFDIPGNTDGISYRLDDATAYVGGPTCVIGGGTSAAEAVIAISKVKMDEGDTCPIYWSYRGDKMPKVSKALSDAFFDAYLGNGNIRYYPNSEPVAIVTGPDREEYLSIRVDRRLIEGRSIETTHLEFQKKHCIACIGEDIPESFLESLGIVMATGGPRKKKRMLVTPLLETRQPNVYLIGDILSQTYLETDAHDADPSTYREIRHPGNIKSALRDGVLVAEVVQQKREGRREIHVELDDAEDRPASAPVDVKASESFLRRKVEGSDTAVSGDGLLPEPDAARARLVRITQAGIDEDEFLLNETDPTTIGGSACDIRFPNEPAVADHHATLIRIKTGYAIRDEGSRAGTFLQLVSGELHPVTSGDLIQLGRQFLVFGSENGQPFFVQYDHNGTLVKRYPLKEGTVVLGREAPDIVLDRTDTVLSRRHLALSLRDGRVTARDLSSLNHTYIRVRSEVPLRENDVFRTGPIVFRFSERPAPTRSQVTVVVKPSKEAAGVPATGGPPPPAAPKPAPAGGANAGAGDHGGPVVIFQGTDGAFPVGPSESILSVARKNNVPINYECESGRCGYDPVRIVSGHEHLNELDDDEEGWTLREVCHLEPGPYRLACVLRTRGRVVVEPVKK